jgi:hypothetical protein
MWCSCHELDVIRWMAKTLTMDDRICEQCEKSKTNYVFDEILIF